MGVESKSHLLYKFVFREHNRSDLQKTRSFIQYLQGDAWIWELLVRKTVVTFQGYYSLP